MNRLTPLRISLIGGILAVILFVGLVPNRLNAYAAGSISLSHGTVPQSAAVVVSGTGFTGNDAVNVYVDAPVSGHAHRTLANATADGNGAFTAKLVIPRFADPGTYNVTAKDTHGVSATQHLTILALIVLKANTSTAPVSILDRQSFFVDALGFKANETVDFQASYPAYNGNTIVQNRSATANANGQIFNVTMYTPPGAKAAGATLTATGQTSNSKASGQVNVFYRPFIFLSKKTVNAGSAATVNGRGYVAYAQIRVDLSIPGSNGVTHTISVTTSADRNGNFSKAVTVPASTGTGTYTVSATGLTAMFKRYARLSVIAQQSAKPTATPAPKATATPKPSIHASAAVIPNVTLPNQDVTTSGHGFPGNATVTVSVKVDMRGGGNRVVTQYATTDSTGNFATAFHIPYKAAAGTYTVTASASSAQASDQLQILSLGAHPNFLNFRWTSLWYHTVRHGTWDYISVQSTLKTQLGIWVHVIFPNGKHIDIYTLTNHSGQWGSKFSIPWNSISRHSNHAYVAFQLWHGKQTTQSFIDFTLV